MLGVTLSSRDLALIQTLQTDLNLFSKSFYKQANDLRPIASDLVQRLFEMVRLKLKGKVNSEAFSEQFQQWMDTKGCDYSNIQIFECKQRRVFTIEHIIKALRKLPFEDAEQTTSFLETVKDAFNKEFNSLIKNTLNMGEDFRGKSIRDIDQTTLNNMDQIFSVFDGKNTGNIQLDRLFFLYLALLYAKPNPSFKVNQSTFITDINQSFDFFLRQIMIFQGRITVRQFKTYLLYHSLTSPSTLQALYKAARLVSEFGQKLCGELKLKSRSFFPSILPLAIKRTLPKVNISNIKENTLDLQLVSHFFLTKFFPYVQKHNHFNGLFIIKKNNLSKAFLQEFHDSFALNPETIYWQFQLTQTFLTIIQNYALIVTETLQYAQNWLLTHNCPFKIVKDKEPKVNKELKTSVSRSPKGSKSPKREKKNKPLDTVYTEGEGQQSIWSFLVQNTEPETGQSPSQATKTRPREKFTRPDNARVDRNRRETSNSIEKMNTSGKKLFFLSEVTKDSRMSSPEDVIIRFV